jgi:hypothetical protein
MKAMEHASHGEQAHARALVRWLLNRNLSVSVFDGEEYTVKTSHDLKEILMALATTDADEITAHGPDGESQGWFHLIWGNDSDGSELIANCTDNDLCNEACDVTADAY